MEDIKAKITMNEAGEFFVENVAKTGDEKEDAVFGPLKFCDEGDKTIVLVKNAANRWWANRAKVTASCNDIGYFPLTFKESKKFGPVGNKLPNEKLIAWLSPEEQEEYRAIIGRAVEAKNAAAAKPMTELEKAKAKAAKAEEAYLKLLVEAGAIKPTDDGTAETSDETTSVTENKKHKKAKSE